MAEVDADRAVASAAAPRGKLAAEISNGAALGVGEALVAFVCASMLYVGVFSPFLPTGAVLLLLAGAISTFLISLRSGLPILQGGLAPAPCAILGVGAGAVAATSSLADADAATRFSTIFAFVALSTIGFGGLLYAARRFRLHSVSEYIPYPVIAGFLASVGWIFMIAAVETAAGVPIALGTLSSLMTPVTAGQIVLVLIAGFGLEYVTRRFTSPMALPAAFFGSIAVFYGVVLALGQDVDTLRSDGWILGPYEAGGLSEAIALMSPLSIDWGAVLAGIPDTLVVYLVGLIAALLFLNAIEIGTGTEIETDRELDGLSTANLTTGFLGASPSLPWVANTLLFHQQRLTTRVPAFTTAAIYLVMAFFASALINYVPKFALGSILILFAVGFLRTWLVELRQKLTLSEYLLVIAIFFASLWFGMVVGVAVGILICAIFFSIKYSTLSLVRSNEHGVSRRSDVERPVEELKALEASFDRVLVFELEGYLFFGTATRLVRTIRDSVRANPTVDYVIIDMRQVAGADSSALNNFVRLRKLAERDGLLVILTEVRPQLVEQLERIGAIDGDGPIRVMGETDLAREHVEDRILADSGGASGGARPIAEILAEVLGGAALAERIVPMLEQVMLADGQTLYSTGEEDDDIYFIESGAVSLYLEQADGDDLRLRKFGPGAAVGITDYYDRDPRDAAARAEGKTVLHRLPSSRIRALNVEAPEVAVALHEAMGRQLAVRLNLLGEELRRALA